MALISIKARDINIKSKEKQEFKGHMCAAENGQLVQELIDRYIGETLGSTHFIISSHVETVNPDRGCSFLKAYDAPQHFDKTATVKYGKDTDVFLVQKSINKYKPNIHMTHNTTIVVYVDTSKLE
jgi:hypothetical protein